MSSGGVFALSIHTDYRCRHSGACCSADWDVPVELPVYRTLQEAVERGRLLPQAAARNLPPFVVEPDLPEGAAAMLERTAKGECVFLDGGTKLCIVHRDLGEPALPATCRYFPRLAVRDNRGTFITLSHFCPTAASMLFRKDCPLSIVSEPQAFPPGDYEGLVVTDNDPPLARTWCDELLEMAWSSREQWFYRSEPLAQSFLRARSISARPVVLLDHCDNAASGGTMDTMAVLAGIIEAGLDDVAAFAICDPAAVEQMQQAVEMGAMLEFVSSFANQPETIREYAEAIHAIGPEHCIVSSDRGQGRGEEGHDSPAMSHVQGLALAAQALRQSGFTEAELDLMFKTNPARLLGLPAR